MPQNCQPTYDPKFNLIYADIDKAKDLDIKAPSRFDPIPINRASSYKVNPTETYNSSDIDVDLGIDINSGFIEPDMPQNCQPYYDPMFNSIGDSIDSGAIWISPNPYK